MNQRGFTLIELLVALAIGGALAGILVPTIFQVMRGTARISGTAAALADIESASHWITRDLVQAQTTDLTEFAQPVDHLTLTWLDLTGWAVDEGNIEHAATFCFNETSVTPPCDAQSTSELRRDYDGQVTTVGRYLTEVGFSILDRTITVTVTSSPDSFRPRPTESRVYQINLRTSEPP